MREFIINENDASQRVDKYIQKVCHQMPKSLMFRLIRQKKIKVNRKRCEPNQMLQVNDTIQMFVSDEFFVEKKMNVINTKKLNNIVFEDDNFLILNKETGIIVHSNEKEQDDTLIQRVIKYLMDKKEYDPSKENSFTPAFANRLDQNTGGLIIACKNAKSLRLMNEMIREHQLEKHYLCIVEGNIKDGLLEHHYIKDKLNNKAMIFSIPKENSVPVSLKMKTIHKGKKYSLLDIHLITGKSHQIRAQLSFIGHPLIGDTKYGGSKIMKHQALYAYRLKFNSKNPEFSYLNDLNIQQNSNFVINKYNQLESVAISL